ncbi:hypothetical protein ACWJJH_18080 [Endozoicomonadaceae bacterium StTr2]
MSIGRPMYHVVILKHIEKNSDPDDKDGKNFYFHLEIPFPPFIGLSLKTAGWHCSEIKSVSWTQNEASGQEYFTCRVDSEVPYFSGGYEYDFDYLCNEAEEGFWEPYTREARKRINVITIKSKI